MKKKRTPIFSFTRTHSGGILLPVMAILMMFTLLLLFVTENHYTKRAFLVSTKEFYLSRIIEEMSLTDIEALDKEEPNYFDYNIGTVKISWNEKTQSYDLLTQLDNQYKRLSSKTINELER